MPAAAQSPDPRRFSPALLLLFVGSGCAALIYEVVWFHLLRLVIGTSAISIAVLLGSFMGGMCLGSLLFPRLVPQNRHPLRVYAYLELGIGAFGIALPLLLPLVGSLYTSTGGSGFTGFVLRGIVCAICLLPPTILMGATLPAIARWMETTRTGIARMGFFYGANIAGAVLGTLLAGFWLLRVYDIITATLVALGINAAVASVALLLARKHRFEPSTAEADPGAESDVESAPRKYPLIYIAIGLSGFTALGAEVIWTRLLSLLLGASVYAFSLILAVFLVGLGLGSGVGSAMARKIQRPRRALAMFQLGLATAIAYGAVMITHVLPYLWFDPDWGDEVAVMFLFDFLRCSVAMLPATFLWGASFPIALAAAGVGHRDPGRLVGGVYAANTIGAIAGSLVVGLSLIAWQGTLWTEQAMAVIAGLTGVALLCSLRVSPLDTVEPAETRHFLLSPMGIFRVLLLASGIVFITQLPAPPDGLIAYGRTVEDWDYDADYVYSAEGLNASVAVSRLDSGILNFHVSGKVVASTEQIDMRLQRMLGHLPTLLHPNPKSVLIVGCGAGVTAGCFVEYASIERIVICEIEPRVPEGAKKFFFRENRRVLEDPRTELILDDARHFLATTDEKFDIITSDPIHPWVRGAAALYSSEYYELVKQRINPGAIVTQWVPLYQTSEESVKSQVGTFMDAFPSGTIWNSDIEDYGYDTVMMGWTEPMKIDVDQLNARMQQNLTALTSMDEVDLGSAVALMKTYAGQASDLGPWLKDAQINDDTSLRLQYLAGLALNLYREETIYGAMVEHRRYPDNLFQTSQPWVEDELRKALDR